MYELNQTQVNFVSGGEFVFVTEQWKHEKSVTTGQIMAGLYSGTALIVCLLAGTSPLASAGIIITTGVTTYIGVYGLSRLDYYPLDNDTWYDFY
jgi:hypothetical protein